ncbi:MAG: hypothetical protein ACE5Q6_18730 [Dehalococcoidia bacterium]
MTFWANPYLAVGGDPNPSGGGLLRQPGDGGDSLSPLELYL